MAYLPVCLKDGRLAAVGQTRTAPHVTEGYGHGPPAIARPLFMLCCSRSSPWGAARHGGRQGDRGFFTPEVSTGLLRSCAAVPEPAAAGASAGGGQGVSDSRGMHDKAGKSLRHMVRGAPVGLCPNAVAGCPCPPTEARRRGHVHDGLFAAGGSPVRPAIVRAVCRDDRSG